MKKFKNIIGGFAGAIALNILHESYRQIDHDAPRIDLVGEEAISKSVSAAGANTPKGKALYASALAGDLLSNGLYFSLIGEGKKENLVYRGAAYGLAAGIGALTLTKPLGLKDAPVTKTTKTKLLTVSWYVFGGLVSAIVIKSLTKKY